MAPRQPFPLIYQTQQQAALSGAWGLLQFSPSPGALAENAEALAVAMAQAETLGLEGLVSPELSLMGYPMRDIIVRHPSLVTLQQQWLEELATCSKETLVCVGFVEARKSAAYTGRPYYNSVAILHKGKLLGIVRKSLLPTYHEYEDWRTFEPSSHAGLLPAEALGLDGPELEACLAAKPYYSPLLECAHGKQLAITICEDMWNVLPQEHGHTLYKHDPIAALLPLQPDAWINISASVGRLGKEAKRQNVLKAQVRQTKAPWLYVNQCGAVDECCFDGASRLLNSEGKTVALAPAYQEALLIVHLWQSFPEEQSRPLLALPKESLLAETSKPDTSPASKVTVKHPDYPGLALDPGFPLLQDDCERIYQGLLTGIQQYFQKTGFQRAILGLSGGLDSAVVAVLLADALGPSNVLALSLPTQLTPASHRSDAEQLAINLGLGWLELPINAMVSELLQEGIFSKRQALNAFWGEPSPYSFAADNAQAMSRATILRLLGNDYGALPVATSDKSEFYLGYTTVNGDMSGALAPIGDVCKSKVRQLARWLNQNRAQKEVLAEAIITRPSGADLAINPETGKLLTAEEALMPYEFADEIIWRMEALQQSKTAMSAQYFYWEAKHGTLEAQQKQAWLDKFFTRMNQALYKWWLAPPVLIIDRYASITKTEYHHPLTACRIDWSTQEKANIQARLCQAQQSILALQER